MILLTSRRSTHRGFSLVEMAVVLAILGLLLGGGLAVLSRQAEMQRIKDTEALLAEAREALLGFAAAQGHLPCPDQSAGGATANDGQEDFTVATGICIVQEGNLPWATLGLNEADRWGNRLRYRATTAFTNRAPFTPLLALTNNGDITINTAGGTALATQIPAIILSHGPNGFGAINSAGGTNPAPPGASELANTNGDTIFISNPKVETGGTGGEFDDLVAWVPRAILFNRMIQAARLP